MAVSPETVETLSRAGPPQNSTGSVAAAEASTRSNATAKAFQVVNTAFLSRAIHSIFGLSFDVFECGHPAGGY